ERDGERVRGSWSLCGRYGAVKGGVRSNELVLVLAPARELLEDAAAGDDSDRDKQRALMLRASLDGDYFDGDIGEGAVEGWRGRAPVAAETAGEGGSDDDEESLES